MKIIEFSNIINRLKLLKRTGWVRNKVPNPESVAEHSYGVAILAMIITPQLGLDTFKTIKMALIHDLAEAEVGDLVTVKGYETVSSSEYKHKLEEKAMKQIFDLIDGSEYIHLFKEYETAITPEAKLVHELDKLEMAIQADEYEKLYSIDLHEFIDSAKENIHSAYILKLINSIYDLRKTK